MNRRGFTLVELMISLVMLSLFAGALVVIVRSAGVAATRSTTRLLADRAVLSLQLFLREELRDAAISDVAVLSPARLAMVRPVGEGTPCRDSGGVVLVPDAAWDGTRLPEGGRDDALLLLDPVAADWQRLTIDSVGRGHCPIDGRAATAIHLAPHPGVAVAVRVIEPVELSAYRSGSADWFGLTPASHASAVQPFAGPLVPGAARFAVTGGQLDILVPPPSAASVSVAAPLRSVP